VSLTPPADGGVSGGQPALPEDAVEVGRVLGAWGIKGGIRVKPFAADPQALFSSKRWFVQPSELPRPPGLKVAGAWPTLLRIVSAREQGDSVVAIVHDLEDRDHAEALKGARIFIPRSSFPTPEADAYYWVDLIGMRVRNRDGVDLGLVHGLIETGPHCVLQVRPGEGRADADAETDVDERLIPFVDAYVDAVDQAARCITVDWDLDF
jgi:16S rRNA processing protein RimM